MKWPLTGVARPALTGEEDDAVASLAAVLGVLDRERLGRVRDQWPKRGPGGGGV